MRPLNPLVEKILVPGRRGQALLIAVACAAFVWYSQKAYFADSEIFSLTIARTKQALDIGQAYKLLFSL
ncbi:MAG: hypothetical protein KDD43_08935, partial [Bdellovibrionales bacterium]|nr:hypothetical protein [Bdellovibrionales bacterium]